MTLSLAIAIGALTLIAYVATVRSLSAGVERTLQREAEAYAAAMKGAASDSALTEATRAYLEARTGAGSTPVLIVLLGNGRVISNSALKLEAAAANGAAREPTTAPAGLATVAFRGERYRVLSAPIVSQTGARLGTFQAGLSTGESKAIATRLAATLGLAGIVVLALGAVLSVWVARQSLTPLRRMADSASAVTHATPGTRIDYDGPPDELGTLADALNSMLDRLEAAFAEQRHFIDDASHELRTPVAILRGNAELLRGGRLTDAEREESLSMIDAEGRRMTRLLDELLSLTRLRGARQRPFQPLDAHALVDEVALRARLLGDRHITVDCAHGGWVLGDPDLLEQALLNIVRNAVSHTREGGTIAIACRAGKSRVQISVTDDGPGIAPEDLSRVFDRFYRAQGTRDADTGGSGLGLAITQQLVEMHGGTVMAGNARGHGAVFTIELPAIATPDA
jgi:two-component system OmpR family sensor kinase